MSIVELPNPPTDAISSVRWSPDGAILLVSAWDNGVYIYRCNADDSSLTFAAKIETTVPILDLAWHQNSQNFYAVGLDHVVSEFSVAGGAEQPLSAHTKASNKVAYSAEHGLVLSTGWDERLHVHDAQSRKWVNIALAAKPFALSITADRAVVAMAERKVHVFELQALRELVSQAGAEGADQQPLDVTAWQQRESSLKFMARDVACMPDGTGFASSSIEGRVGVEWFDEQQNKQTYAFKCHRDKSTTQNESGDTVPLDIIYPVNAIAFHPVQQSSFATGGGDGVIALWDAKTKRRIRQYAKLPSSVAAMEFSPNGRMLAVGISPGFEDGMENEEPEPELIKIFIRHLGENEAKGKPAKDK